MGLLDSIHSLVWPEQRALLSGLAEGAAVQRAATQNVSSQAQSMLDSLNNGTQFRAGSREMLQANNQVSPLNTVTDLMATDVSSARWRMFTERAGDTKQARRAGSWTRARPDIRRKELERLRTAGELEEITVHPMLDLLYMGNPMLFGTAALYLFQLWLELRGEAWAILDLNSEGMPQGWAPIPPTWVTRFPDANHANFEVNINGRRLDVPPEAMFWVRMPDSLTPYGRGRGRADSVNDELEIGQFAGAWLRNFFNNNTRPDTVVSIKGANSEVVKRMNAEWDEKLRGTPNASRTVFVGGDTSVHPFSSSLKDSHVDELLKMTWPEVLQHFRVPPEKVGLVENSNRATIDAADFFHQSGNIVPRLETMRWAFQLTMVPKFDPRGFVFIDYDSPVPADKEHELAKRKAFMQAQTRAEQRRYLGDEPHEDGSDDVYVLQTNQWERPAGEKHDGVPPPTTSQASAAERSKGIKESTVNVPNVLEALRPERLVDSDREFWDPELEKFGQATLNDLGVDMAFDMQNPLVRQHIGQHSARLVAADAVTRDALRTVLTEGVLAGEGAEQLAARVGGVFADAKGFRALRIARTEVGNSGNFAVHGAHVQSGVVAKREWLTRMIDSRDAHIGLNNQRQDLMTDFVVPDGREFAGATALRPFAFGIAALDINCNCMTMAVGFVGEEAAFGPHAWAIRSATWERMTAHEKDVYRKDIVEDFDASLGPWRDLALAAYIGAFEDQEEAVLARLRLEVRE